MTDEEIKEQYEIPKDNHDGVDLSATNDVVVVGTPNTLQPPAGFPKYLYRGGDATTGDSLLCANQEIADDWAKRGFFPEGETGVVTLPIEQAPPEHAEPKLMDHQHALDAPQA